MHPFRDSSLPVGITVLSFLFIKYSLCAIPTVKDGALALALHRCIHRALQQWTNPRERAGVEDIRRG